MGERLRLKGLLVRSFPLWSLLLLVAAITFAAAQGDVALNQALVTSLVQLMMVVGLYVFVGNSGIFSFGHVAFAAIGAYTAGILTIPVETKEFLIRDMPGFLQRAHTGPVVATIVAGAIAAVVAAVISLPLMRLSGLAASLATLALLIIVHVVAENWTQVTNGQSGMSGLPTTTGKVDVLVWCFVAMTIAFLFQRSSAGLRLKATREDEVAARAAGIGVYNERRIAWTLSAFVFGAAGGLYAQFLGSFDANAFYLSISFIILAMLVVGGVGSLAGAVIGTITISVVSEVLRRIEEGFSVGSVEISVKPGLREVCLAALMLLILLLKPDGLTGGRELSLPSAVGWWPSTRAKGSE